MGIWSSIASAAKNQAVRKVGRFVTYPIVHPGRTLQGAGAATKTAVVGGGMGYLAWEKIANGKPVVQSTTELMVGEETAEKVGNVVSGTVDGVGKTVNAAGQVIESAGNMLSGANGSTGGLGNFFQGLFSGNGLGMIGDFFKNIGNGKVSGLGLAGLIGAAFLCFGRFGWLGKIAGAILGMMVIGNNFNINKIMGGQAQQNENPESRSASQQPEHNPVAQTEEESSPTLRRGR